MKRNRGRRGLRWVAWIALLGIALGATGGCTSVRVVTPDGHAAVKTSEEFAEYVERVFRHHNRVVNELIVASSLSEADDVPADHAIIDAEEQMAAACQPLNRLVSAMAEGREPGVWMKLKLVRAAPACEASTRRVELLIPGAF